MTETQLDISALEHSGTEIIRYRVAEGERSLLGRRREGGAEIVDVPTDGRGESYRVDGGYQDDAVLQAFIEDYVEQAARLDRCPMGREAIGMILAETETDVAEGLAGAIWTS